MSGIGSHDPRSQAHVSLTYKTPQNQLTATRQHDMSIMFATGRQTGGEQRVLARSASRAYETSAIGKDPEPSDKPHFSRQTTALETAVHPPFLTKDGRWDQQGLPHLLTGTQGQPATTTGTFDGTVNRPQAPKAISAVYSYHDISPVLTTEHVHDSAASEVSWNPTINKRGTTGVYEMTGPEAPTPMAALVASLRPDAQTVTFKGATVGDPAPRKSSVDSFWHRTGETSHLQNRDVERCGAATDISKKATPGTANTRLIGGKWRYLERPVEGTPLFTDYYGRCDKEHANYHGRSYDYYLPQ